MNGRKWTALSTLVSGAVAAALLAGTLGGGGQSVYASEVATISGATANAGVQVQNLETAAATAITMQLWPQSGAAMVPLSATNIPGEGSANFYLPSLPQAQVPSGAYGAVLTSDKQIAAIARHEWLDGGRKGAATYGSIAQAQEVILPLVLGKTVAAPGGYAGQLSEFSVQNAAEAGSVSARVDIYRTGSSTPVKTLNLDIPAGTSKTVKMGDFNDLPDTQTNPRGFVGYARVTGTAANPLVVQSFVDFTTSNTAVYAFSGVASSAASTTLYTPLLRRDFFGTTGVSIVNPGTQAATITVNYFNDPLSPSKLANGTGTEQLTIPAASSVVLYNGPRAGNPLPDSGSIADNNGWFGSAQLVSNQPILAVVNDSVIDTSFNTLTSAAYNATSATDGATKIFAPLVRRRHVAQLLTTGIQVQNVGTAVTDITVTYKKNDGSSAGSQTLTGVQPGRSVNFYQDSANATFPTASFGSAVITGGQPLVLIVNDSSLNGLLDAALYNGLK